MASDFDHLREAMRRAHEDLLTAQQRYLEALRRDADAQDRVWRDLRASLEHVTTTDAPDDVRAVLQRIEGLLVDLLKRRPPRR